MVSEAVLTQEYRLLHDEKTGNRTNVVRIVHDTETVVIRLVEIRGPSVHLLRGIHHHTDYRVSKVLTPDTD